MLHALPRKWVDSGSCIFYRLSTLFGVCVNLSSTCFPHPAPIALRTGKICSTFPLLFLIFFHEFFPASLLLFLLAQVVNLIAPLVYVVYASLYATLFSFCDRFWSTCSPYGFPFPHIVSLPPSLKIEIFFRHIGLLFSSLVWPRSAGELQCD